MATAEQIKAARALLKWKQSDLAELSGVSLPSINNIERAIASPRAGTLRKIRQTMEDQGVEFLDDSGVRLKKEPFEILQYDGPDFIEKQNDDLFHCMQSAGDEVVACSLDESMFPKHAPDQVMRYASHQLKTDFRERILVREGDMYFLTHLHCYRWLPKTLIGKVPYLVYKNRFVLIMWEARRVVIVKNQAIADSFRTQFEYLWTLGKKLPRNAVCKLDDPAFAKNLGKKR
ncbi:MAG: helix-turn-helix transcriptional regulator [Alphaproteobacteria bacterium]|nr:helix-turn-helix transcriptional regulator [Alphaproteobacteria bacterium]